MTTTFGLQGAHEKGADEFDALLEDVHNAGLSRVVRVIGASLVVKIAQTEECRLRHMLEEVGGFWGNIAPKVQKDPREEADDTGKGSGRGKRGQAPHPEA